MKIFRFLTLAALLSACQPLSEDQTTGLVFALFLVIALGGFVLYLAKR